MNWARERKYGQSVDLVELVDLVDFEDLGKKWIIRVLAHTERLRSLCGMLLNQSIGRFSKKRF